jgi:hypothetical protein
MVNGGDGYFKNIDIKRNLSSFKHERDRKRWQWAAMELPQVQKNYNE